MRVVVTKLQATSFLAILVILTYCIFTNIWCCENFTIMVLLLICTMIYLNCICLDFNIGMYVISYANSPITYTFIQKSVLVGSTSAKLGISFLGESAFQVGQTLHGNISAFVVNFPPFEPSPLSNWRNTLPIGRGWDYEAGNVALKTKGALVHGVLGNSLMKKIVDKVSPDNPIITPAILYKVIKDPESASYIWNSGQWGEIGFLGPSFWGMWKLFIEPQEESVIDPIESINYPRRLVLPTRLFPSPAQHAITIGKNILEQNLLENREQSAMGFIILMSFIEFNPNFVAHPFLLNNPELWWTLLV